MALSAWSGLRHSLPETDYDPLLMPARGGPRTTLPDGRQQPRFAGVATFCRFPLIDSAAATRSTVDWAVYGVPFDGGVTYRPGARFGPRAIRDASQYIKPFHLAHGVDIVEVLSLVDAGDAQIGRAHV